MEGFSDISVRNYSYVFNFEKEFDYKNKLHWLSIHWIDVFYYIISYICIIFGTKHYMKDKPRFSLRPLLTLWSIGLATFSMMAFARTAPEFIDIISNHGFYYSVCAPSYLYLDSVTACWTWLYVCSKIIELGDTVFIVLRKQPLIFLHWYHHVMTLLVSWYGAVMMMPTGRWFMFMNLFIHSIMYSYYGFKAMHYRLPRQISMFITTLQIIQMLLGCGINIYVYYLLENNVRCPISYHSMHLMLIVYLSYFMLFANFFYQSYLSGKNKDKTVIKTNNLHNSKSKVH